MLLQIDEMSVSRDADTATGANLADILSSALPPDTKKEDQKSVSSVITFINNLVLFNRKWEYRNDGFCIVEW